MVQLLPFLGNIVEPEDKDARPEGDREGDEEQGDQILHGCKHENNALLQTQMKKTLNRQKNWYDLVLIRGQPVERFPKMESNSRVPEI